MAMTKDERLAKVHAEALSEFDDIQAAQRPERMLSLSDRRFYSIAGAMWEGALGEQFENKPRFEINKIHMAVMRVITEYRQNRISVQFIPKDGSENDETADACNGLYRADEQDSTAEEAYDNAFEEAVGGGMGAWRLRACYEDEYDDENDRQRIRIEPIVDADSSVFFDLNAKRQDKADAKSCYVVSAMARRAYEDEYNDSVSDWPKSISQSIFDWCTPDVVYLCEVYKVEETTELVHFFRGVDGQDMAVSDKELKEDEEKQATLEAVGFREVRQKRRKVRKVHKYLMSGGKILRDEGYIAGDCIPIIPVYGKRWFVDNIERCMGHVRLAKDAQRLLNMQISNLGEIAALTAREKPILTTEQVAGLEMFWAEDNVKNYPYLLVNPIRDADGNMQASGPVGYTKPPSLPPALAALIQFNDQALGEMLGNSMDVEQVRSNVSGEAVEQVIDRVDAKTAIYMSNMAKAMKRSGEVWLSMARELLVEEGRKMKSVSPQDDISTVELNTPAYDLETGETTMANDMSKAKFDVWVDVGPSSSSRRKATVKRLVDMMMVAKDPETLTILGSMAIMNMEGEGIQELRDFYRKKLVQMGAVKPTPEEEQEMQAAQANQQPDPNAVYLLAEAEKSQANAVKAKADTIHTLADTELTKAQTLKTLEEAHQAAMPQQVAAPPIPQATSAAATEMQQAAESPQGAAAVVDAFGQQPVAGPDVGIVD